MKTRSLWKESSLLAIVVIGCRGCAIHSATKGTGLDGGLAVIDGDGGTTTVTCSQPVPPPAPGPGMTKAPCDIYAEDGGPCVAAHSTVRALYAAYNGPLYQLRKADGSLKDIAPLAPGDLANSADQDAFCGTGACTVSIIYDQSGRSNHLTKAPPGGAKRTGDNEANARSLPIMLGGRKVYGLQIVAGVGYRNNSACGTATGDNAETEYMVVGGKFYNGGCCFDYGNMERNSRDKGEGTMEAVYFGNCTIGGKGAANGPWVM